MKELIKIQQELNAPKNQRNNFGGYNYRSCEDILEAVKPLLSKNECLLNINDEIVLIGERYYIKAIATITNKDGKQITSNGYARESENKKGMDSSQITGAASSYARKYALNGLFLIDDAKDADATNTHGKGKTKAKPQPDDKPWLNLYTKDGKPTKAHGQIKTAIDNGKEITLKDLFNKNKISKATQKTLKDEFGIN